MLIKYIFKGFFIKKLLLALSIVFTFFFLACSSGDGSSSSLSDTNSDGSVTKTLSSSTSSTNVDMKGDNGEKLSLVIPALPVGSEDLEVNFKINYTDGLPKLVVDKDIDFVSGVSFSLQSDTFKDGEFTLIYLAQDGTQYSVPYTQDGDTITATLTHFSEYQVTTAPSQGAIEGYIDGTLSSWESNNAGKTIEDIGMSSLESIQANIDKVQDTTKRADFSKRFQDALLVLAENSLKEWRSIDMLAFSKYCMTQEFKALINKFARLYFLFENFGASNDQVFQMLQDEIVIIVNAKLRDSHLEWLSIQLPTCDAIELPAYMECTSEYIVFIEEIKQRYFDSKVHLDSDDDIIDEAENKIVIGTEAALSSPDACECVAIYKTIILEYFHANQIDLINDIDLYLTTHCENSCPFLWNISYSHSYTSMESGDPALDVANASFKNVFIYPRGDYYDNYMSLQEEQECSAYIDDNGRATQTTAVTYSHTIDGYSWDEEGAPSFYYSCISGSDCGFRDSKTDTPFNKLDAGYLSGEDLGEEWKQYGYPRAYLQIEEDIFEEIYKREAFSISDSRAQMSFTPVEIR